MFKIQEAQSYNPHQLQELKKLVARGEGLAVEFKRKVAHPEKIAKEFVALANTKGGVVLIGVDDDGTIHGVKHAEGESHALREALKACRPAVHFQESFIPVSESKLVIRYVVNESEQKPHFLKEKDGPHAYVRVHEKSMNASKQLCEIMRRSRKKTGVQFTFGEHEKLLMEHLEAEKTITLKECSKLLKINPWRTSRKLVLLVLADILLLTPTEKGDLYSRRKV
jgi:predicted HTH transcriptional regulator